VLTCYRFWRISLKTTLVIAFKGLSFIIIISIFNPTLHWTLETTTHNWPWLKTSYGKNNPVEVKHWSWNLFIVMAEDRMTRNYLLINLKGHGDCDGRIDIYSIYTSSIFFFPIIIFSQMTWFLSLITINLLTQTLSLIQVPQKHDWCLNFEINLMIWQTKYI